jgi:hypothetical protein
MPIPSIKTRLISEHFLAFRQSADRLRQTAEELATRVNATVRPSDVLRAVTGIKIAIEQLTVLKDIPGIEAHAASELSKISGASFDDTQAALDAAQAVVDWAEVNLPKNADGDVVEQTSYSLDARGALKATNDTAVVKTGELSTLLTNLIALIA